MAKPKNKIRVSVNLMKLIGAHFIPCTSRGRKAFVLDIERSRAELRTDPKGHRDPELWIQLEAVESPNMRNEQTHFVTEPLSGIELAHGAQSNLIGTARFYELETSKPEHTTHV